MAVEMEDRKATLIRGGVAMACLPAIVGFFAVFAPLERGPWIALACALPLVVSWPVLKLYTKRSDFSPRIVFGCMALSVVLTSIAFMCVPLAYLRLTDPTLWQIWSVQVLAMALGLLAGLALHDPTLMEQSLNRRYTVIGNDIVETKAQLAFGLARQQNTTTDWVIRAAYWVYVPLILIGMLLGGGTPLILLSLLEPVLGSGNSMDSHAWAITILGFIVLSPAWFIFPALIRLLSALKRIKDDAGPQARWVLPEDS